MVKHEIQSVTKAILQVLGFFLSPLHDLDFFSFVLTIMNGWAWLLVIVTIYEAFTRLQAWLRLLPKSRSVNEWPVTLLDGFMISCPRLFIGCLEQICERNFKLSTFINIISYNIYFRMLSRIGHGLKLLVWSVSQAHLEKKCGEGVGGGGEK